MRTITALSVCVSVCIAGGGPTATALAAATGSTSVQDAVSDNPSSVYDTLFDRYRIEPNGANHVLASTGDGDGGDAGGPGLSLDDIARELSNPVTALRTFETDFEFRHYQGDLPESSDQRYWAWTFRPSYPIPLRNGRNILLRATIPVVMEQPTWVVNPSEPFWREDRDYVDFLLRQSPEITPSTGHFVTGHGHVDDVEIQAAYGGVNDSGFISMYGFYGVWPISQDISGSRDQVVIGPEVAFGKMTRAGVIGALLSYRFSVSGDDTFDTRETWLKVFFSHGLGNGWQIISNPTLVYDSEADSGNQLLLPLGGGIAKTLRIARMPLRIATELQYYAVSPDRFGPEWMLRISLTPVLSQAVWD